MPDRSNPRRQCWRALAVLCVGVFVLYSGCIGTSDEEFRAVTDADVQERERETVAVSDPSQPVAELEGSEEGIAAESDPTPQSPAEEADVQALDTDVTDDLQTATAGFDPPAVAPETTDEAGLFPVEAGDLALNRPIKLLVPERTFVSEGDSGTLRVSFDDLDLEKVLNVVKPPPDIAEHFPDWLAGLDGQRIRVRGFMGPVFQSTDLRSFTLGLNPQCFFGPNRKIYHLIEVALRDGVYTDYIHERPFDVEGIFRIRPDVDGGELWQLYQIEDAVIIEES